MDARRLPWQDLQFFLATAQGGSLAAAAAALTVSSATVHRRVAALERRLGARLFVRSPRGYALTAAGGELLAHAQAVDAEILAAERRLGGRDEELSGRLRVSTVDDLAIGRLGGVLRDFTARHPRVCIELSVASGRADLAQRQADVALRPGSRPSEGDVIARRVCAVGVALYASRVYVERHGLPEPKRLAGHRVVRADPAQAFLPMERYLDRHAPAATVALRSDSMLARLAAVRDGIGIGLLPCFAADADGALLRIGQVVADASAELWIVIHADLRRNARVRSFADFAHQALGAQRSAFEGTRPLALEVN